MLTDMLPIIAPSSKKDWLENAETEIAFVGNTKTIQTKNAIVSGSSYTMLGQVLNGKYTLIESSIYPTLVFASYDETTNTLTFNGSYKYSVIYEPM